MTCSRSMSRPAGAMVGCLIGLLAVLATAPSATAGQPLRGKPRIVALEGFIFPVDLSLAHWRVGALMVSRYPKVLPRAFPEQVRKLLRFRAYARLEVLNHNATVATGHNEGGLPVALEGRSLYYVHLFLFSTRQTERILDGQGAHPAQSTDDADVVERLVRAAATEEVQGDGETLATSMTQTAQKVELNPAPPPPRVVNGCQIGPQTRCSWANLAGVDLSGANLSGALMTGANFTTANLSGADLSAARFGDANFSRAVLTGTNLFRSELSDSDLSGADLTGANVSSLPAFRAKLVGAKLVRANLTDSQFLRANVSGADFTDANLTRTNFAQSNLRQAIFCRTTMPDGTVNNRDCR